jgi:hypothetical protein
VASLPYPAGVRGWLAGKLNPDAPRLELSQALGAFGRPGEGISPLYVFFDVTNTGTREAEITRVYVGVKGEPVYDGPFERDSELPGTLAPGESMKVWARAKALAGGLKQAGYGGRPRARLVVEDAGGNSSEKAFRFRVDDYLRLEDE